VFVANCFGDPKEVQSPNLPPHWKIEVTTISHLVGPEAFALVGSIEVSHPTKFETWFECGDSPDLGSRTDRVPTKTITGRELISHAFLAWPGKKIFYRFMAQVEKQITPTFDGKVKEFDLALEISPEKNQEKINSAHNIGHENGITHVLGVLEGQSGAILPLDSLPSGDYKHLAGINLAGRPKAYFLLRGQKPAKDYFIDLTKIPSNEKSLSALLAGSVIRVHKESRLEILPTAP